MKKIPALLITLSCLIEQPFAQTQKIIADKIVAQVGDKIILNSDIEDAKLEYKRQGLQLPADSDCAFMEGQLMQKELAIQAAKDSISIDDDELDAMLDQQLRQLANGGNSISWQDILHLKESLRQPFKERKLAGEMRNKITGNIKITPAEVRAFFEKIPKDSLPYYESEMQINQLIVHPKIDKDVEKYEADQLLNWKQQVESGRKKFDMLAKLYSQDPDSREQGGQYSLNRNDRQWDPLWFAAIWKLKEGQISLVVKSKFGLHIIQLVSRVGDDAIIRHILLLPKVTQAEIDKTKAILDSVRTQVLAGNLSVEQALNTFSEQAADADNTPQIITPDEESFTGFSRLDKNVRAATENMNQGDISRPMLFKDETQRDAIRLIFLRSKTNAHRENWKDDYDKIAQRALDQKKNQVLAQWFKDHIKDFSVSVDNSFANCENVVQLLGK